MMDKEYFERTLRIVETEWFPNHRAIFYRLAAEPAYALNMTMIRWANPENYNYSVCYLLSGSTLFVTGDIGSAVYRWSALADINLHWIAHTNFPYFHEKFESLNGGACPSLWLEDICLARARQFFKHTPAIRARAEQAARSGRAEWQYFCNSNREVFGDALEAFSFGEVPHNRCIGHWRGLQIAMAQLA